VLRFLQRRPASTAIPGGTVFWILALMASGMLLLGWLLPWFVEPTASGIGTSPQDVIVNPTDIVDVLVYVLLVTMLILVLSPIAEIIARVRKRPFPRIVDRTRLILAIAGFVLTVLVFVLVRYAGMASTLGPIDSHTITDSAVWLTMYGYGVAALTYGARQWVLAQGSLAFGAGAVPFGVLLPFMFHQAPSFLFWAASALAIYMLLALGLNIVVGFAGLLDLGYAAFFAIGAYACASLASPTHHVHLSLWLLIFIGAGVAAVFGGILGAPTLRLRGDYLAIVTLGFGEIIPDLATNNALGLTGGPNGLSGIDQPIYGVVNFGTDPRWFYWSLLAVSVIVVVFLRNTERSRVGRAWVAIREDEVAAAATGISTVRTKLLAFSMGASVAGIAGAFYGSLITVVTPDDFSFAVSVAVLSMIVLGGIGSIVSVILGSSVLTLLIFWIIPHLSEWSMTVSAPGQPLSFLPGIANINFSQYTYMVYGVLLIGMMNLRPGGLLPSRARRVELETGVEAESLAAVQGRA
jgi:branched-chain amino acid transport system permease protein